MQLTGVLNLSIGLTGVKKNRGAHLSYLSCPRPPVSLSLVFPDSSHALAATAPSAPPTPCRRTTPPPPLCAGTTLCRHPRLASPAYSLATARARPRRSDHAPLAAACTTPRHRPRATPPLAHCLHADAHASPPLALPVLHSRIHTAHANCSTNCPSRFLLCFRAAFAFPHSRATI